MSLRLRLLVALFATAAVAFFFLARALRDDVKARYFQVLEDSLFETAHLLAAQVEHDLLPGGRIDTSRVARTVHSALNRIVPAEIFGIRKDKISLRVYITDAKGVVRFDSADFGWGKDYSRWNDVYLTLKGRYGARSSRDDTRFPGVSVKYIAAPIRYEGKIVGVLTTGKPAVTLEQAIDATKDKILATIIVVFAGFILMAFAVNFWITRPIDLLARWLKRVRLGFREPLPKLGSSEIGALGREFDLMQAELDGRRYIENFVQMLTHEFKTPVAGILGAAEILERELPADDRRRFLANITREAGRIHRITDSLLTIAKLENTRELPATEWIHLKELVEKLADDFAETLQAKNLQITVSVPEVSFSGNYFFLYQALANLLQNAVDFSAAGGALSVTAQAGMDGGLLVTMDDTGSGIPDYALDKIFTKFYSLERPDTGRKGTGLGLAFVAQVMKLHGGSVRISNREGKGVRVELSFPGAKKWP